MEQEIIKLNRTDISSIYASTDKLILGTKSGQLISYSTNTKLLNTIYPFNFKINTINKEYRTLYCSFQNAQNRLTQTALLNIRSLQIMNVLDFNVLFSNNTKHPS